MRFYTNVACQGNYIYYRGIENGRRVHLKREYSPTLFVPSKIPNIPVEHKDLQGNPVEPMVFDSISDAREFVKNYEEVESFTIFGNSKFEYAFIADQHPEKEIEWKLEDIVVAYVDIEVGSEVGMPNVDSAENPITAITIKFSNDTRYYVFGYNFYSPHRSDVE